MGRFTFLRWLGFADDPVKPSKPNMPFPVPKEYKGPKISSLDAHYTFGYGKPSAGMLSSEKGGKSFGVYGQGNETSNIDLSSAASYGVKIPLEDPENCDSSYMAVSVLVLADKVSESFRIKSKAFSWSTYFNFTIPSQPSAGT